MSRRALTVVSTGGARLHTEIHGRNHGTPAAPTVVLAHGWTCDVSFWYPVIERLAATHRVVVYDQRGHGRTPATPRACGPEALADDLCAVLAATVPPGERAVLGGHSMGAMAIMAAAGRPEPRERVSAALLCSTGADRLAGESTVLPLRPGTWRSALQRRLLRTKLPYGPLTPVSQRVIAYVALGPDADAAVRRRTARIVLACPRRARAEWGGVLARLDLAERLPALEVPVTVLHGENDRLTPPVHAHRLAARLPHCQELIMLRRTGHMTPLETPDRVADLLRGLATARPAQPEAEAAEASEAKERQA